jgi:hypothetical protein
LSAVASASGRKCNAEKKHADDPISTAPRTSCTGSRVVRNNPSLIFGPRRATMISVCIVQRAQTMSGTG